MPLRLCSISRLLKLRQFYVCNVCIPLYWIHSIQQIKIKKSKIKNTTDQHPIANCRCIKTTHYRWCLRLSFLILSQQAIFAKIYVDEEFNVLSTDISILCRITNLVPVPLCNILSCNPLMSRPNGALCDSWNLLETVNTHTSNTTIVMQNIGNEAFENTKCKWSDKCQRY